METFVYTRTALVFDYLNPKAEDISMHDMMYVLAREQRFNNMLNEKWSVLQHSMLVHFLTIRDNEGIDMQYTALHHDLPEAYFKDLPSPLRSVLRDYEKLYRKTAEVIEEKYDMPHNLVELPQAVQDNDWLAAKIEWYLFSGQDPSKFDMSKEIFEENNKDGALLARISELLNSSEAQIRTEFFKLHCRLADRLEIPR